MKQTKFNKIGLLGLVVFFISAAGLWALTEFSAENARRVDLTLKRIGKEKRSTVFLKKITFSQDELNSYLNLIYVKRYSPEVKYIKLNLERNNEVSGIVKIKLEGAKYDKVPSMFRDIQLELSGKVECENYRMRFLFENIKLNGTSFSPEMLDEAFGTAQSRFKVKKSLYDWFNLMPGIKNVIIEYKKIIFFY